MSNLMKIGELAQQTGLSMRTLHDDDEIGLPSPSGRTRSGHRLSCEQDIIRLLSHLPRSQQSPLRSHVARTRRPLGSYSSNKG